MADRYNSPIEAFAYYTEVALATVESLPARTSQRRRERFEDIANGMVLACFRFGIPSSGNGRLAERLNRHKGGAR